jgi:hypothetical protein
MHDQNASLRRLREERRPAARASFAASARMLKTAARSLHKIERRFALSAAGRLRRRALPKAMAKVQILQSRRMRSAASSRRTGPTTNEQGGVCYLDKIQRLWR